MQKELQAKRNVKRRAFLNVIIGVECSRPCISKMDHKEDMARLLPSKESHHYYTKQNALSDTIYSELSSSASHKKYRTDFKVSH